MKVKEFIEKLNELGFDEETELTFGCIDGDSGDFYALPFEDVNREKDLEEDGDNIICVEVDVDSAQEYLNAKATYMRDDLVKELDEVLSEYREW